jgi:hypothetical protein
MVVFSKPEPISGDRMHYLSSSAMAWRGSYRWSDPDSWDDEEWTRLQRTESSWGDGQAALILQDGDLHIAKVDRERLGTVFYDVREGMDPVRFYGSSSADIRKHWHTLVAWSEDETSEVNELLGVPSIDGFLIVQTVFAQDDELVPVFACWFGRKISNEEASIRLRRVLDTIGSMEIRPKKPAPQLPEDLLLLIEEGRSGDLDRTERKTLVEHLLELDRASFLEALDRMAPWMLGRADETPLGWLNQNTEIADRLWRIKEEIPTLEGKMRLAPWKSGMGNPMLMELHLKIMGRDSPTLKRRKDGTF